MPKVHVRVRKDTNKLFVDFQYRNARCREMTALADSRANRAKVQALAARVEAALTLGAFEYHRYFPDSPRAALFTAAAQAEQRVAGSNDSTAPTFAAFAETWLEENEVTWRFKTLETNRCTVRRHLIPEFGEKRVSDISKADLLAFRSSLAKVSGRNGNATLSAKTINHTLGVCSSILAEAADRFQFTHPAPNLKRLKQQRPDIHPFSLDEVKQILKKVREDYRDYFTVRFFTGMRAGEIHGLKWKYVDFERKLILVRETYNQGRTEYTKTDGSQREIAMSSTVFAALKRQQQATGASDYVFHTRSGAPLNTKNLTERVWYPLLRNLGLERRRPYQCRHTAATLWLAAGENPGWIARQLGHTTTEMLFRVYARFVPNLTRQDGSAMDRLLRSSVPNAQAAEGETDE